MPRGPGRQLSLEGCGGAPQGPARQLRAGASWACCARGRAAGALRQGSSGTCQPAEGGGQLGVLREGEGGGFACTDCITATPSLSAADGWGRHCWGAGEPPSQGGRFPTEAREEEEGFTPGPIHGGIAACKSDQPPGPPQCPRVRCAPVTTTHPPCQRYEDTPNVVPGGHVHAITGCTALVAAISRQIPAEPLLLLSRGLKIKAGALAGRARGRLRPMRAKARKCG
jgi:hypothetical protein